jgi:hypothetical protein
MKSLHAAASVALFVAVSVASTARASIEVAVGDKITLNRPAGTFGTPGGIFKVDVLGKGVAPPLYDFSTFCVQTSEFISLGTTYNVFNISKNTVAGGVPLGSFAAWLYNTFLNGGISIYDNGDANAVQAGIWLSMGYVLPGGFSYDSALLGSLLADYKADPVWSNGPAIGPVNEGTYTGDIYIMNLKGLDGSDAQDQLVRHMPEPMSLLVWSLLAMCATGLSGGRRRAA